MARRSGSNSSLIGIAILIGAILLVPQDVWVALIIVGVLVFAAWFAVKKMVGGNESKSRHGGATKRAAGIASRGRKSSGGGVARQFRNSDEDEFASFVLDEDGREGDHPISASWRDVADVRWVPPGETVSVAGFTIHGGMLYIGTAARNEFGLTEPSFINPKLRVQSREVDWSLALTDYWPTYSGISPDARRAYLQWLADGRRAPDANIGYVFLFLYGLERRILVDLAHDSTAADDVLPIRREVHRLLGIYDRSNSFRRYATHFLGYIEAGNVRQNAYLEPPPPADEHYYELPLSLKIGLGQLAEDQKPVPADWALAWALNDPNIYRRTPVTRCKDEFSTLFKQKYGEAHGEGFVLKRNKTRLRFAYQPASSGLRGNSFQKDVGNLPDVTAVRGPIQKLQALVDACTGALDSYSRFVGRNPDRAHALEGLLQLPMELWPLAVKGELEDLRARVGSGMVLMSFGELSGRLKSAGPLSRDKVRGLAQALEALHLGMEPDVLRGSRTPKPEDRIALFATQPEDGNVRTAPAYQAAAVTLDLACMAIAADGVVSGPELIALTRQIDAWTHLSAAHRKRLKAHLRLGIDQPATLAGLKKKLEPLAVDARHSIGRLLAHLTQADGVVSPSEVKFLERAYKTLGLDTKLVYSDLHQSEPGATASQKPTSTGTTSGAFTLDPARIAQLEKETAEVSVMLANVFVDAQEDVQPDKVLREDEEAESSTGILGLDADHSAFVRLLVTRSSWLRSELSDAASDMELMLDGALEHINEAIMDAFDAPLTEGDDPIEINSDVLEALPV